MKFKSSLAIAAFLSLGFGQAHATGGLWDSSVAGYSGTGANSANPWVSALPSGAAYAEWNFFSGLTSNTPDIAGTGSVAETSGSAFVTGGGNIYSFAAPTSFTASLNVASVGSYDVWLRVGTIGNLPSELASLNGVTATKVESFSGSSGSAFGGSEKEWYWKWSGVNVTSISAGSELNFVFNAADASMSLDQLGLLATLNPVAAPVPEPDAMGMMVAGLIALGVISRRRSRS